ncbi:MAG: hypothetical protein IPN67_19930 [Bacteroidales bacterium]|nr:hypothetical protein [Bacteroidales bacterium]
MALEFTHTPTTYNFSLDPILWVVKSGKMTGVPGNYEPDEDQLFCYVEVKRMVDDDIENAELIAKKSVPYSRLTGEAEIDISGVIDLHPTLPDPYLQSGPAGDTMMRVVILVADMYGIPSAYETQLASDEVKIIYGSSRTIIQTLPPTGGFDLHAYVDHMGNGISKRVSKSQPDWIYFVLTNEGNSVDVKVTLEYSDGTTKDFDAYSFLADSGAGWAVSGYTQLEIDDNADPLKTVVAYTVKLKVEASLSHYAAVSYQVVGETEWEQYLIMDNGVGGVESVLMQGKNGTDITAERSTAYVKWDKNNYARGSKATFGAKAREELVLRTGWTDNEAYIFHLRQLMVGHLWILDMVLGFVRVLIKDNTLKDVRKSDETLYALEVRVEMGFDEEGMSYFYKKWIA